MRRAAPLILGGGPAGSAAAITLARAGVRPIVLERTRETGDALCGGFLSWRTLDRLRSLGLDADRLNRRRITRVHVFAEDREAQAPLPFPALAVSRHKLDTLMLELADRAGAGVERGVTARTAAGREVTLADGATLDPPALFLATGKHDLRGLARPKPDGDPTLGIRVRLRPSDVERRRIEDAIELHLFDRGYAGLAVQEDGSANLCLAVRRSRLHEAGDPERLLQGIAAELPAFADRLDMRPDAAPTDAVANVPYGWRATDGAAGLFRLGDQAAVIPSLAGEGMGIAVASGCSAAGAYLRGGADASVRWQCSFARRAARPVRVAGLVRDLAEGPVAAPALPWLGRVPGLLQMIARATRIR
ncbi:NAD(P)/FAD-dependent oxidoreductase [Sphingomonas lenta]|uniref:FAD-binding monooxygenase n=1 Tax=Sphingomonas lenta TaxID=1141887 RepID=A0A2A2SE91_9SPHN|nr:FAD-dependent monooxygenase [Sphingomonas lenta]PAX07515.1 FAD-binding monooxygenase [Sphingomonas lenta]